jgi:hypothetical protein
MAAGKSHTDALGGKCCALLAFDINLIFQPIVVPITKKVTAAYYWKLVQWGKFVVATAGL